MIEAPTLARRFPNPQLTGRRLGGGGSAAHASPRGSSALAFTSPGRNRGIPSRQFQRFRQSTSPARTAQHVHVTQQEDSRSRCCPEGMASIGYYDDRDAPSSYRYGGGYARPAADGVGTTSVHLFLFLATASLLGAASLYSRCESAMESLFDQVRVVVVLSPLLLLLAMQYWAAAGSGAGGGRRSGLSSLLMAPLVGEHSGGSSCYDQRRDGSSPWSVALALALVLLLISYQSCFQDWWFPLVNRRR